MKIKNKKKNKLNNSSLIKQKHFLITFFKFFLTIGLIIGSIISIVLSIFYSQTTNNTTSEFGKTYSIRYEIDLNVNTNNKNLSGNEDNSRQSSETRLKNTADSFEEWLFRRSIYTDGVQYSMKEYQTPEGNQAYRGWIFTNLYNIDTIEYLSEDVDQDPMRVLNDKMVNNFIEIIPYDENTRIDNDNPRSNEVLVNSLGLNITNGRISDTSLNKDNNSSLDTPGVEFNFPNAVNIERFMNYKAGLNNPNDIASNYKWFVFNDLDKLVQRLNYVKSVCWWRQERNHAEYIRQGRNGLLPILLYDDSLYDPNSVPAGVENLNHIEFLYQSLTQEERTWGDIATGPGADMTLSVTKRNILDFYNQFDSAAIIPAEKTTGNFDSSIQPLVERNIIAQITHENYHIWFPQASELSRVTEETNKSKNIINPKLPPPGTLSGPTTVTRFKIPVNQDITIPDFLFLGSQKNPENLLNFFNNYSSFAPLIRFANSTIIPNQTQPISFFGTGIISPPLIKDSIVGLSAYNSIFLASGIILLTIGIIVSLIYRVPGLLSTLAITFTSVVTMAFSGLLGLNFSFGSFLAILIGTILTLVSSILFLERIRKNIIDNKSIFDSSMISIRKSVTTIIDIHFISIMIGLSCALLGVLEMVDFGFELILASLVSMVSTFLIFIFIQYNFSKSKLFWNKKLYFFNIQNKIINKEKNEKAFLKKINAPFKLSKWFYLSVLIFILTLIIIIVSLVLTIGVKNSLDFQQGTSIYIYQNINVNELIRLLGGSWNIKIETNNVIFIQSSLFYSEADVISRLSSLGINEGNLFVATSAINVVSQIASINVLSLLAGSGFVAIYSFVRLGLFSILPIFISTVLTTLFVASLQYILFIPIDNYFIYAMTFVFLLNNILSVVFISIIKSRFTTRKIFNHEEIKIFLQKNIMNLSHLWISLTLIITLSIGISMIFISTSLIWSFFSILISSIISVPMILILTSFIYYNILIFRQKYIKNIIIDNIANTSYKFDAVDEQIIEGINYRG